MHLILTGATGLVGGAVLDAMLSMPEITRISILTRRPVPMLEARIRQNDPIALNKDRVRVILHKDFSKYDDALLSGPLRGAAGVVWALGISQLDVSKEEYVTITKTYSLEAAKAFQHIPADDPSDPSPPPLADPFRFIWVSGEGASTNPGIMTARFGRVKGETELALADMTNAKTSISGSRPFQAMSVRPAGVDPINHPSLLPYTPDIPSFAIRALRATLSPAIRLLMPSFASPTEALGPFLAELAMGKYDARIMSNSPPVKSMETVGAKFKILPNVAFRQLFGL